MVLACFGQILAIQDLGVPLIFPENAETKTSENRHRQEEPANSAKFPPSQVAHGPRAMR